MQPEVIEALEAIDATLAGEAVDPCHAELAELALLLRAERPDVPLAFSAEMDQRVRERFARRAAAKPAPRPRRPWLLAPAAGLAASIVVAVVIVVSEGGSSPVRQNAAIAASGTARTPAPAVSTPNLPAPAHQAAPRQSAAALSVNAASSTAARIPAPSAATSLRGAIIEPLPNGRRVIHGGQLALSTAPSRIETVAQEVFQVAGQAGAIVQNSTVTASQGPGAYAQFQLSIPSGSLPQAMASLSTLPYAHVASRTDTTQDVNNQYLGDVRALADARSLRAALLRQLSNATTQAQIDSLTARIHDADASISSDEAALRSLNHQIGFSQVTVTINAAAAPVPVHHGGGFTLSKAAHDAGRVLTVAAGVALIGAAALVPFGLLAALGWWVRTLVLRRRREHALDLV